MTNPFKHPNAHTILWMLALIGLFILTLVFDKRPEDVNVDPTVDNTTLTELWKCSRSYTDGLPISILLVNDSASELNRLREDPSFECTLEGYVMRRTPVTYEDLGDVEIYRHASAPFSAPSTDAE